MYQKRKVQKGSVYFEFFTLIEAATEKSAARPKKYIRLYKLIQISKEGILLYSYILFRHPFGLLVSFGVIKVGQSDKVFLSALRPSGIYLAKNGRGGEVFYIKIATLVQKHVG